jgi:hypothetical protein
MKSFRAEALRFIRSFLSRTATVDLREEVLEDLAVFVCLIRTVLVDDDFDDFEEEECDFCADRLKGNKSRRKITANLTCLIVRPPNALMRHYRGLVNPSKRKKL